ncbi:MAG: DUF481 domain-containing protein [Gammaproteobacteria bacterium]|nr:DUF481 domain-containing protein [Gammaproteobacteria bacterium]
MIRIVLSATLVSLSIGNAFAELDTASSQWKGEAELGFVSTSGNTETETVNAKAKVTTDRDKWRHRVEASALNSSDAKGTTAERYAITGQSDYKVSKQNYFFGLLSYEKDRFNGYAYRVSEALGYGRRILDGSVVTLDLEIGPGARQSELDNGDSENEFIVRGAAKLGWTISDTSQFSEALTVESGDDATIIKSVTGLTSQLAGSLAMKITYTIKNTSDVPPGIEKTDKETAVTLVYRF